MEEFPEWGPLDEEELAAIEEEAASSIKRRNPSLLQEEDRSESNNGRIHLTKTRRFPTWATVAAAPRNLRPVGRHCQIDVPAGGSHIVEGSPCPKIDRWKLSSPSCREINLKVRYPVMTFGGCIIYSRAASEVENATMKLLETIKMKKQSTNQISLGFDIEWRPIFKQGEAPRKAAVMQICMDSNHCYVMHIIHSGIPPILRSLLDDSSIVKVGVCIANDAAKILRDYSVRVEALEDLSGLANLKIGGVPKRWSLCSLTEMLICKQLEKPSKIRTGNWEVPVLSKEQLHYAATDAFISWYLYEVLQSFPNTTARDENVEK